MAKELNEDTGFVLSIKTLIGIGFDMKDQMIRQTIMTTQEDVKEIKKSIEKIEEKLYE